MPTAVEKMAVEIYKKNQRLDPTPDPLDRYFEKQDRDNEDYGFSQLREDDQQIYLDLANYLYEWLQWQGWTPPNA